MIQKAVHLQYISLFYRPRLCVFFLLKVPSCSILLFCLCIEHFAALFFVSSIPYFMPEPKSLFISQFTAFPSL